MGRFLCGASTRSHESHVLGNHRGVAARFSAGSAFPPGRDNVAGDTHERIRAWLDRQGVTYEVVEHPPAGSAQDYQRTLGTRLEQQAKALLVEVRGPARYAVVALQAQKRADLDVVARLLGGSDARLADRAALLERTGCAFGELPPMGAMFGLPLLLDRDLLGEPLVYFNAGRLDRSIRLAPRPLADAEKAVLF